MGSLSIFRGELALSGNSVEVLVGLRSCLLVLDLLLGIQVVSHDADGKDAEDENNTDHDANGISWVGLAACGLSHASSRSFKLLSLLFCKLLGSSRFGFGG